MIPKVPDTATPLFILVMVWLRTRLQYPRARGSRLRLRRAGVWYFSALLLALIAGWRAAPGLARLGGLSGWLPDTAARAAWFLASYAAWVLLHRALKARGIQVFSGAEPTSEPP